MAMAQPETVTLTSYADCLEAYRNRDLKQALYDEGGVIMDDVLVTLHGTEHRDRRRLENRLFRRQIVLEQENDTFPPIVASTLAPYVAAGEVDLVPLGHQLLLNLSAPTAGLDRPLGTPEETAHLYRYLMTFIEGATLAHSTRDHDEVRREVRDAIEEFRDEFFGPALRRRRDLIAAVEAGELDAEALPRDILTVLLSNTDRLDLPDDVILREIAFYLLAGAHTSATAFTRTLDAVFTWLADHPGDDLRLGDDRLAIQRFVHETVRLNPSSPVGMRTALAPVSLSSGIEIPLGALVVFDLMAANRDISVFGPDAAEFVPGRVLPDGVGPYGLSFGSGMHACIGQELAAGVLTVEDVARDDHIHGLVSVAVQALLERGARPDPSHPPVMDTATRRPYWSSYRVTLSR